MHPLVSLAPERAKSWTAVMMDVLRQGGLGDQNRRAVSAETCAAGVLFLVFWVFDRQTRPPADVAIEICRTQRNRRVNHRTTLRDCSDATRLRRHFGTSVTFRDCSYASRSRRRYATSAALRDVGGASRRRRRFATALRDGQPTVAAKTRYLASRRKRAGRRAGDGRRGLAPERAKSWTAVVMGGAWRRQAAATGGGGGGRAGGWAAG